MLETPSSTPAERFDRRFVLAAFLEAHHLGKTHLHREIARPDTLWEASRLDEIARQGNDALGP